MFQAVRKLIGFSKQQQPVVNYTPFTPDMWKLEEYYFQNVFIYNEMMKGCSKFGQFLDGNSVKLSAAFTKDDHYVLWQKKLGEYSTTFALPMSEDQMLGNTTLFGAPAKILGQVYAMRADQIKKLDEHLENGIQFVRKRIKIEIPYSYVNRSRDERIVNGNNAPERKLKVIPAWAYIGRLDYWSEQIDPQGKRFSPVKKYIVGESGEPYYFYAEKLERKNV